MVLSLERRLIQIRSLRVKVWNICSKKRSINFIMNLIYRANSNSMQENFLGRKKSKQKRQLKFRNSKVSQGKTLDLHKRLAKVNPHRKLQHKICQHLATK